ncbi:hypothetical protein AX14_013709 [Amanita brunnescens Koide BX004]|nr:hypothetical protein AX14_013709 [Amanita brunnescens Koide BX004]
MVDHVELECTTMSNSPPLSYAAGPTDLASLAESNPMNRHDVTTASFIWAESTPPLSTPDSTHHHGQGSMTNRTLSLTWHGIEQVSKRIEPFLNGAPFKVPSIFLTLSLTLERYGLSLDAMAHCVIGCCSY